MKLSQGLHGLTNSHGPAPLRSADWPEGFPWLRGSDKVRAQTGTELVKRCLQMVAVAHEAKVHWLWEHPEDLGPTPLTSGRPASVWSWHESRSLFDKVQVSTVALYISARLARITENLRGWLARGPTCQRSAFQDGLGSTGCAMWGLCPKSAAISIQRSSARTPRAVFVRSLRLLMGRRSARLWPSPCWPPRPLLRRSPRGGGSLQMRPWMEQFSRVAIRRLPRVSCCNKVPCFFQYSFEAV